tara:strand:- start:2250 stop:2645 length:396 start_codon:yes stop_codon:yes gene_type:complete
MEPKEPKITPGYYPDPNGDGTVYMNENGDVVNPVAEDIRNSIKKYWPYLKHFTFVDEGIAITKKAVDIMTTLGKKGELDRVLDYEKSKAYTQEYMDKKTIHPDCEAEYGYPCSVFEYKRRKQFEGRYTRGE